MIIIRNVDNVVVDIGDDMFETEERIVVNKADTYEYMKEGLTLIDIIPPEYVIPQKYTYEFNEFIAIPEPEEPVINEGQ